MVALTSPKAMKRASKGADWLDRTLPNWWLRINVGLLDMSNLDLCVGGQLFIEKDNGYAAFMEAYGLTPQDAERLGFDVSDYITYEELDEAWTSLITDRRLAASIV